MCDVYETADVWDEKWRRARKVHRCSGCREDICPKELYKYYSWVHDGTAGNYKHCARCAKLLDTLNGQVRRGDPVPSPEFGCGMTWVDAFGEEPPEEVVELAFMNRVEVQELAGKMSAQRGA